MFVDQSIRVSKWNPFTFEVLQHKLPQQSDVYNKANTWTC